MNRNLIFKTIFIALVGAMILAGCSTVPVTGRKSLILVSSEQESQLGLTSFNQMKEQVPVSKDPAVNALVQKVGKKIAAIAPLPNAQWEFVVFESQEANAFCLPGGKVGVYTGILPITQTEAGLATVIGHEVAHAVARHGAERLSHELLLQGAGQAIGSQIQNPNTLSAFNGLYGLGTKVGVELPHSRAQESEADHMGLIYMARAGYDPKEAVAFWQRFKAANDKAGSSGGLSNIKWLRTHPLDDQRIADLQKLLPAAEAEYKKAIATQPISAPPAK
jgi:metalloendopeptidase OMA1, mitochondrial